MVTSFSRAAVAPALLLLLALAASNLNTCNNNNSGNNFAVNAFVLPAQSRVAVGNGVAWKKHDLIPDGSSNSNNNKLDDSSSTTTSTVLHSIRFLKGQTSYGNSNDAAGSGSYVGGSSSYVGGDSSTTLLRNGPGRRSQSPRSAGGWLSRQRQQSSTRLAFGSMEVFPVQTEEVQVLIESSNDSIYDNNNVVDQRAMDLSVQAVMEQWQQKRSRGNYNSNNNNNSNNNVVDEQVTQTVRVSLQDGDTYPFSGTISTPVLNDEYNENQNTDDSVVMVVHNAASTPNTPQLGPASSTGGSLAMSNSNGSSSTLEATVMPTQRQSSLSYNSNNNNNRQNSRNDVQQKTVNGNQQQSFSIPQNGGASQQVEVELQTTQNGRAPNPWEARIEVWHGTTSGGGNMENVMARQTTLSSSNNQNGGDCRIALDVASMHPSFQTKMDVMPPSVLQRYRYNPSRSSSVVDDDQYLEIRIINTGGQALQASVSSLAAGDGDRLVEPNSRLLQEQSRILGGNSGYRKAAGSNVGYGGRSPSLQPNPFLENDNSAGSRNLGSMGAMGGESSSNPMSNNGYSHRTVRNANQARVVGYGNGERTSSGFKPANDFDRYQLEKEGLQRRGGFLGNVNRSTDRSINDRNTINNNNSGFLGGTRNNYNRNDSGNNAWAVRSDKIAGEAQERNSQQTGMMKPPDSYYTRNQSLRYNANNNSSNNQRNSRINSIRYDTSNKSNNSNGGYSRLSNLQKKQKTSIVPRGQYDGAPRIAANPFLATDQPSSSGRSAEGWLKRQMTGTPKSTTSYRRTTNSLTPTTSYIRNANYRRSNESPKVQSVLGKMLSNNMNKQQHQPRSNPLLAPNPYLPQDRRQSVDNVGMSGTANSLPRPSQAFGRGRVNGQTQSRNRSRQQPNALPRPSLAFGRSNVRGSQSSRQSNSLPRPSSAFGRSNNGSNMNNSGSYIRDRRSNALPRPAPATGMMYSQSNGLQNALPRPSSAFGRSNNGSMNNNSGSYVRDRRSNTLPRPSIATGSTSNQPYRLQNSLPRPSEAFGRPRIAPNPFLLDADKPNQQQQQRSRNGDSAWSRRNLQKSSIIENQGRPVQADAGLLDEKASRLEYGMVTEEERLRSEYNANGVNKQWDLNYWMDNNNNGGNRNNRNNRNRTGQRSSFGSKSSSQRSSWSNRGQGSNGNRNNYNRNGALSGGIFGGATNGNRETATQLAYKATDSSMEDFRNQGGTRAYTDSLSNTYGGDEMQRQGWNRRSNSNSNNFLNNQYGRGQTRYRRNNNYNRNNNDSYPGSIQSAAQRLFSGRGNNNRDNDSGNYQGSNQGRW